MPPILPTTHQKCRFNRRTVPRFTWEMVTGVEITPCREFLGHTLANRALVYPYLEETTVLKTAGHWDINSSALNSSFVEPAPTQLYVRLPSSRGSVERDRMFSSRFVLEFLNNSRLRDKKE